MALPRGFGPRTRRKNTWTYVCTIWSDCPHTPSHSNPPIASSEEQAFALSRKRRREAYPTSILELAFNPIQHPAPALDTAAISACFPISRPPWASLRVLLIGCLKDQNSSIYRLKLSILQYIVELVWECRLPHPFLLPKSADLPSEALPRLLARLMELVRKELHFPSTSSTSKLPGRDFKLIAGEVPQPTSAQDTSVVVKMVLNAATSPQAGLLPALSEEFKQQITHTVSEELWKTLTILSILEGK